MVDTVAFALSGAWTKLARAEQHLQTLRNETRAFLDGHHYSFVKYLDPEASRYLFVTDRVGDPPISLGAIFGDYIHNLRSALDHLAWQFALIHYNGTIPKDVERQVQFPIGNDKAHLRTLNSRLHMTADQLTFVEGFHNTKSSPFLPLVLIRDLDNVDKHQGLHTAQVSGGDTPKFVGNDDATVVRVHYERGKPLIKDTEFASVVYRQHGPDPNVEMETFPVDIVFGPAPDIALNSFRDVTTSILDQATEEFFGS